LAVAKPEGVKKQKPEKNRNKDRRKQERFACDGFAEVVVDDAAFLFRGNIRNLSLGGCYIQSHARLQLNRGAEADLHFNVGGDFFHARAQIMLVRTGAGVGFEFLIDDPELQRRIAGLIEKLNIAPSTEVIEQVGLAEKGARRGAARSLWDRAR